MEEIRNIGVIGCGQMGRGIVQVFAQNGYRVVAIDSGDKALNEAQSKLRKSITKFSLKEGWTADEVDRCCNNIVYSTGYDSLAEANLIVEAVPEDFSLKKKVICQISPYLKPTSIFASNTSSYSISELANASDNPTHFVGMHFMNPVPIMKLVELIKTPQTKESVFEACQVLMRAIGKETIVSKNYPGFVINRILMPMINEAAFALYEGVATREDIDKGMRLGTNQPMGPLALADLIGLDTCLSIMMRLHEGFSDSKYRPCPLLRNYVEAGWCGQKSGKGFYDYA